MGALRCPAGRVPRRGPAARRDRPGDRRGGVDPRLGALRGHGRRGHRDADLRGLGAPPGRSEEVRLHARVGRRRLPPPARGARVTTAPATRQGPLWELLAHGQSAWYDYIRRSLIESGELARLIEEDALRGITSNPSIWEKAIDGSSDYDAAIAELVSGGERDPVAIYEHLAVEDLRAAAQAFEPAYREAARGDGYVSIEVAPEHARDTGTTIAEARRLWEAIGAENLMVKVPGTPEGIPAIRSLTAEGINVNITLLFAVPVYEQVAEAYLSGLEDLAASGGDLSRVASVASFFVSRIDTVVDGRLEELCKRGGPEADGASAHQCRGPIANAKLAYAHFRDVTGSERWRALAEQGAHPQRLLWASTGVKNPKYPELLYVEELIGPDTVDTVPPATFDAFREHGRVRDSLEEGIDDARRALADLDELGISLPEITEQLTADGIDLFEQAFAKLFGAIAGSAASAPSPRSTRPAALPAVLDREVASVLSAWQADRRVQRLWSRE